jgi:hypothetical protein
MTDIKKKKEEYNPEIKLSHRTNLIIQLVAFIVVMLIILYVEHTSLGNFPIERLFKCSGFMIWVTAIQCALCTFKGGKFVLLWLGVFILIIFVKRNNFVYYNCLVTVEKIVSNPGGKSSSYEGIYVDVCGCPDKEMWVQCPKFFYDMENLKIGDTLLATLRLYPDGILPGGISDLTTILIKDYTLSEKEEYTKPSYWYYSFFPSCVEDYGCNIVYKVPNINGYLTFTDIRGKKQSIPSGYKSGDTVLVYKNIKLDLGKKYEICSQKINTPENWAKISDYGYLFESDIYGKEEVEKECPGVKQYVEKFKERNKQ